MPAPKVLQQKQAATNARKDELLYHKEQEWLEVGKVAILMGVDEIPAMEQAATYQKARIDKFDADDYRLENNLRNAALPYWKEISSDIESIIKTGKPAFGSIHDLVPQEMRVQGDEA